MNAGSTIESEQQARLALPYRVFDAEVVALRRLSPSFLRVTLTGDDLGAFADNGYDQRFKLVLPLPEQGYQHFPRGADWYPDWRALPEDHRNPLRTYTVRELRPQQRELVVDLVLHGDAGPASRWATQARIGSPLVLVGPHAAFEGPHGGVAWHPAAGADLLLVGDETAVPAIASILQRLPDDARGHALIEVPQAQDALDDVVAPAGMDLMWFFRGDGRVGDLLVPAVQALVGAQHPDLDVAPEPAPDPVPEGELLWDVADPDQPADPDQSADPDQALAPAPDYAWVAGEAGMVAQVRRFLLREAGRTREAVASMGYWKYGISGG